MAQAKYYNSTIGGKTVHYIAADPEAINVEDLGGAVLSSSSKFGINGTFFDDKLKKYLVLLVLDLVTASEKQGVALFTNEEPWFAYSKMQVLLMS